MRVFVRVRTFAVFNAMDFDIYNRCLYNMNICPIGRNVECSKMTISSLGIAKDLLAIINITWAIVSRLFCFSSFFLSLSNFFFAFFAHRRHRRLLPCTTALAAEPSGNFSRFRYLIDITHVCIIFSRSFL